MTTKAFPDPIGFRQLVGGSPGHAGDLPADVVAVPVLATCPDGHRWSATYSVTFVGGVGRTGRMVARMLETVEPATCPHCFWAGTTPVEVSR